MHKASSLRVSSSAAHPRGRRAQPRSQCLPVALLLGLALALLASPTRAADKAAAEALFRDGKALMGQGRIDEACEKFAASVEAEAAVGALLNLALCHEKQGKLASAWAEYRQASDVAGKHGDPRRERAAADLAAKLEPKLSKLVVQVDDAVVGMEVLRNGEPVPEGSWGTPLPVDPGDHEITASAPGYATWSDRVRVGADGDEQTLVVPALIAAEQPDTLPAAPADSGPSTLTVAGGVVLGVGLAAVVVSAIFGGMAADEVADAEDDPALCDERTCTQAGRDQIDEAKVHADVSTATFVIGTAALVAGVVMLVWPDDEPSSEEGGAPDGEGDEDVGVRLRLAPIVGPTIGGVGVAGSF